MPTQGALIQLKAGLHENYVAIENKDLNTIYFCTDTQQMFIGETEYTRPVISGTELPTIDSPVNTLFYHTTEKALYSNIGGKWAKVSNDYTHPTSTAAGTFGEGDKTAKFGGTLKVPYLIVDGQGHVTGASSSTVTLPSETTLSKGTDTTKTGTIATDRTFQAVTGYSVSGHKITAEVTTYTLPEDKDTTYTFGTGSADGAISVTPKGGTATDVKVKGLGGAAYKSVVTAIDNSASLPTSAAVQTAINTAISGVTQFDVQVVDELPTTGKKGVIYLVKHEHASGDTYDEYIWNTAATTPAFEKIGNTDIDLSAYMKTADADAKFIPKVTGETGEVAKFKSDGTIESTGFTLGKSVPADAKFTDTVYSHPAGSAASKALGLYKISTDATSHVNSVSAVEKDDITALGIPAQDTTYGAEKGIALTDGKFGHSNAAITANTTGINTDKTLAWGSAITLKSVKHDAYGHVTGTNDFTITMPANPNTDSKVKQNNITANTAYPVILSGGTGAAGTFTGEVNKATTLTYNPAQGTLTVPKIEGIASKATADADGNDIKETYATKAEVTAAALVWGSF